METLALLFCNSGRCRTEMISDSAGIPLLALRGADIEAVNFAGDVVQAPALPFPLSHEFEDFGWGRLRVFRSSGERGGFGGAGVP
jgi:hypothetical protein